MGHTKKNEKVIHEMMDSLLKSSFSLPVVEFIHLECSQVHNEVQKDFSGNILFYLLYKGIKEKNFEQFR